MNTEQEKYQRRKEWRVGGIGEYNIVHFVFLLLHLIALFAWYLAYGVTPVFVWLVFVAGTRAGVIRIGNWPFGK